MEKIDKETSLRIKKAKFHKKEIKLKSSDASKQEKQQKIDLTPYITEQKQRA